jgi:hypothetical protein
VAHLLRLRFEVAGEEIVQLNFELHALDDFESTLPVS